MTETSKANNFDKKTKKNHFYVVKKVINTNIYTARKKKAYHLGA